MTKRNTETSKLLQMTGGLRAAMRAAADEAGVSEAEAWRRAARVWLLLPAPTRQVAGSVPLADED